MKRLLVVAAVCALPLFGGVGAQPVQAGGNLLLAANCSQRVGPFTSQYAAQVRQQALQAQGYSTSGIWGQGGVVSGSTNRRYFFNVFYAC